MIIMLGKSHLIVSEAIIVGACLAAPEAVMPVDHSVMLAVGGIAGALAPDLDKEHTLAAECMPKVSRIVAKFGHRKGTHTIWALILLGIIPAFATLLAAGWKGSPIACWFLTMFALLLDGFWFGYLLHLLEDNMSVQGVMFLYPLTHYAVSERTGHEYKARRYSRFRYHTGGSAEALIRCIAFALLIAGWGLLLWQRGCQDGYWTTPDPSIVNVKDPCFSIPNRII